MIGKILPAHAGFAGTVAYVLRKEDAVKLEAGTLPGDRIKAIQLDGTLHLHDAQAKGYRRSKPVFHAVLALHPDDRLSEAQWGAIAERYMSGLGYKDAPWFAVKHSDTDHEHIHIVGLRLSRTTGRYVRDGFEKVQSRKLCDAIDRDYGLVPGGPQGAGRKAPRSAEVQAARREGKEIDALPRQAVWRALDSALEEGPKALPELGRLLEQRGVRLVPNVSKTTDRVAGLRYVHAESGRSFRAGELGKDAKLTGLAQRGVGVGDAALLRGAKAHDALCGDRDLTPAAHKEAEAWRAYLQDGPRRREKAPTQGGGRPIGASAEAAQEAELRRQFHELRGKVIARARAAGVTLPADRLDHHAAVRLLRTPHAPSPSQVAKVLLSERSPSDDRPVLSEEEVRHMLEDAQSKTRRRRGPEIDI